MENKFLKKAAKVIRIITIPPLLVLTLIMCLYFARNELFKNIGDLVMLVLSLVIIPSSAYVVQKYIPHYKDKGRDGQRNLAFIMSFIGYLVGFVFAFLYKSSDGIKLIYGSYFVSIITLLFFNKVLKIKASGHSCSIVGALVFLIYFIGIILVIPATILFLLIIWSSLYLKRHKLEDIIYGGLTTLFSFAICYIIFMI